MKRLNTQPNGKSLAVNEAAHIAWHPAFVEAIKLELEVYQDILEFYEEYPLSSEPLKIDCVVIKKLKEAAIVKNIAAIFREANLLEYKSPGDYVSIEDFYKVYGYACLYASFERIPITSLTISFIESHHPRELLGHLQKTRGYAVEENSPGIYTIRGDILPIQVIDSRKLSVNENLWLKELNNNLKAFELERVLSKIYSQGKAARIKAYLDAITRANKDSLREVIRMSNTALTLDEIFEEAGLVARWEAKGEAKGEARGKEYATLAIAQNMINLGYPAEAVASATQLKIEKVRELSQE